MVVALVSTYQYIQATYLRRSLSQAYSIALLLEVPDSPINQVRPDSCPADFEKKISLDHSEFISRVWGCSSPVCQSLVWMERLQDLAGAASWNIGRVYLIHCFS